MRQTNFMVILMLSYLMFLTLLSSWTTALTKNSNYNSNDTQTMDTTPISHDQAYSTSDKDECMNKSVIAIKFDIRENFAFFEKKKLTHKRQKKSMMNCLKSAFSRNLTQDPVDFNKNFLSYSYPASSSCLDYQHTIAAQIKVNYDFVKLKVGKVDDIKIYAVLPNKFTDIVLIENFLHENIGRTMQMFENGVSRYNKSFNQISDLESFGAGENIVHALQLFDMVLSRKTNDIFEQSKRFTIKGPGTLLYLLGQHMRCYAHSIFPYYLEEAFDEIERVNNIWFNFDIRKKQPEQKQNLTIFIKNKTDMFLPRLELTKLYKVVSVYVNDEYYDNIKLLDKIEQENFDLNPERDQNTITNGTNVAYAKMS